MAASNRQDDETSGCRFPLPVSFDDDSPTPDFCRVVLTVDGLTTRRPLIGRARATNAAIAASFAGGVVDVDVVVNGNEQVRYRYRKPLPYDVVVDRCRCDVMAGKPARIVVVLAKAARQSWAAHRKYLISPPAT